MTKRDFLLLFLAFSQRSTLSFSIRCVYRERYAQVRKAREVDLTQRKPRILIAEDNKAIAAAVERLVSSRFDVIAVCNNGADAVRTALALQPDVVLLEVVMPVLDGIQAVRQIRTFDRKIKMVMVSGMEDEQFVRAAIEAGAQRYVFKRRLSTHLMAAIEASCEEDVDPPALDPVVLVKDMTQ